MIASVILTIGSIFLPDEFKIIVLYVALFLVYVESVLKELTK